MSIQAEYDHLNLLLNKYIDDNLSTSNDHNIKSQKNALWKLIADLRLVFEYPDSSATGELFKGATQNIKQGFQKLFK